MNIFKKKSLCAALAGIGALGAAGAAQAVNLNPDGLGQVLIYPYYTTRSDGAGNVYNSLLSVVNSTASVRAVKVRFLEGKNSREVLDFNLFLSPKDVWTAGIVPMGGGAGIVTTDRSCTIPAIPAGGKAFVNFAYTADGAGSGLDRTTEGYVEIIEMATFSDSSDTADNVTHVNGVPPGCADQTDALAQSEAISPSVPDIDGRTGIFGGITLINVNSGTDYTADAVALDNFTDTVLYENAGSIQPDLTRASPPTSVVFANGFVYTSFWAAATADPVSAVLMHDHIMNEFVLDANTTSGTDWVVTMPTKRYYVSNGTGTPPRLFQRNFNKTDGACDDVDLNIYDREENTTSTPLDFSPPPPTLSNSICWEANVITFNNSNVLGSANKANVPTSFENGWLDIGFFPSTVTAPVHTLPNDDTIVTDIFAFFTENPATYVGLPVVGFAVQSFTNGRILIGVRDTLSNYGGNFVQKGTRFIDAPVPAPTAGAKSLKRQQ
jgi:ribosomal protein S28E/S33